MYNEKTAIVVLILWFGMLTAVLIYGIKEEAKGKDQRGQIQLADMLSDENENDFIFDGNYYRLPFPAQNLFNNGYSIRSITEKENGNNENYITLILKHIKTESIIEFYCINNFESYYTELLVLALSYRQDGIDGITRPWKSTQWEYPYLFMCRKNRNLYTTSNIVKTVYITTEGISLDEIYKIRLQGLGDIIYLNDISHIVW